MALLASSTTHLLLPRLFRPPPPVRTLLLLLNPPSALPLHLHSLSPSPSLLLRPSRLLSSPSLCRRLVSSPCSLSSEFEFEFDSVGGIEADEDSGDEITEDEAEVEEADVDGGVRVLSVVENRSVPELSVKEKKELASYAHSLGDKLKSQQVGKSGVSDNSVMAFNETLEANELLKVKIHRTCPVELDDVVKQLELRTGSVAVGQIGRIVIFYRPSISKLKAVEKKKQARKVFLQRKMRMSSMKPTIEGREREPRESWGSPRGSSRFLSSKRSKR